MLQYQKTKTSNSEEIYYILQAIDSKLDPAKIEEIKFDGDCFYYFYNDYPVYYWHKFVLSLSDQLKVSEIFFK